MSDSFRVIQTAISGLVVGGAEKNMMEYLFFQRMATRSGSSTSEVVSNLAFGGLKRNRLFITASQSVYSLYVETQGLPISKHRRLTH